LTPEIPQTYHKQTTFIGINMTNAPDLSNFSKEEIREVLDEVRHPFEIAVYSSENYFNMASIIRTGHSFLCKKFWMIDFNQFYEKATMGTHKWENVEKVSLVDFWEKIGNRPIVAFERRANLEAISLPDYSFPENPILFFGSEKFGVPDEVLSRAHSVVTIPLYGVHNDLNISVAAGMAMYAWTTQYYNNKRNDR
jgi:tRNA G18 (ribose-2'-O)-methylase SpoU